MKNELVAEPLNQQRETEQTSTSVDIDFEGINEEGLERFEDVIEWLELEGKQEGKHYVAFNPKRDDYELGSFKINTETGQWADFAIEGASGGDLISLVAYLKDMPQGMAALELQGFLTDIEDLYEEARLSAEPVQADLASSGQPLTTPAQPAKARKTVQKKPHPDTVAKQVYPVTGPCPDLPKSWGKNLGSPAVTYTYRNAQGELLGYVLRFQSGDDKKPLPCTLWEYPTGFREWKLKGFPQPYPLYNLDKLSAHPDTPVLVVEGEKSADAAEKLFPDHVVTTCMHGAGSVDKADLSPMYGRDVFSWPDNDEPGQKYANDIAQRLLGVENAGKVSIMKILDVCPGKTEDGTAVLETGFTAGKGWDAADALAEGWTAEHIKLLPAERYWTAATKAAQPVHVETPAQSGEKKKSLIESVYDFVSACFGSGLVFVNDSFLGYQEGHWPKLHELADIEKNVTLFLGDKAKPKTITGHIKVMKALYSIKHFETSKDRHLICLRNGTLDPVSRQLLNHSPGHQLRNQLDVTWDPQATCPQFLKFLDDIFRDDLDKQQKIDFLQEWFGYCLIPDTSQHKLVWLVGRGGNGKSVLLSVLVHLVGEHNCSHAHIQRFDKGDTRAALDGKLLNVSGEMTAEAIVEGSYLKQIVSGEYVEADAKFGRSFSFKPVARIVAATNELPHLSDNSDGFERRAIILRFNRKFTEGEQDRNLTDKLLQEKAGILAWAVAGLQRLKADKQFVIPGSSIIEVSRYRADSNPVQLWLEEHLQRDDQGRGLRTKDMYELFKEWAEQNGFRQMNNVTFGKKISALGFEKHKSGDDWYWNLKWKPEASYEASVSPYASKYVM
jgi:putative DNA primase/helicase